MVTWKLPRATVSPARRLRQLTALDAPVIEVSGLTKRYGEVEAVRGIDLAVRAGETFGFLGPNGAGKTTTIKILCTLANATSGTATVAGFDTATQRDAVRRNIGLVFQDTTFDGYLTAEQNLRFHAELYGVPKAAVPPRMRQVLDMVGPVGPQGQPGQHVLRRHAAAGWRSAGDCCTRRTCCSSTSRRSASTRRPGPRSGPTSTNSRAARTSRSS